MRIASLLPSATEILFASGAGGDVVGVTDECDYPPAAAALPALTSSAIDHERRPCAEIGRHIRRAAAPASTVSTSGCWASCGPASSSPRGCARCARCPMRRCRGRRGAGRRRPGALTRAGHAGRHPATAATVGAATGHEREAGRLVASMRARIDAVGSLPPPAARPRVACLEWTSPAMAAGHWVPELARLAGGRAPLGQAGEPSRDAGLDEIVAAAPDVVVLMPCGFDLARTLAVSADVTRRPGFGQLPAARTGGVVAVDGSSYFNRPGPRILDGLEQMAAIVRAKPGDPLPAGAAWVRSRDPATPAQGPWAPTTCPGHGAGPSLRAADPHALPVRGPAHPRRRTRHSRGLRRPLLQRPHGPRRTGGRSRRARARRQSRTRSRLPRCAAVGPRPVGGIERSGGGEGVIARRVPCPAVLQLGSADRDDVRRARRPPHRRVRVCAAFLVQLADAQAPEAARPAGRAG